ncbi:hypothetical protein [Streptoalloteichus hindustanus]|uniref:PE family protein n=1 Tax=Streptoalloteichus hindustanus TaxID=2017 RepID=A0A1M5ADS7_STRHI|nr:hypothetical protein [Streptoalloteichus hindustanus]SHF28304.1 hypothetical protein SAMN05444320_10372 [Streptoalloteichus hindustanus]
MSADSGVPKLVVAPENVEGVIRGLEEVLDRLDEINEHAQALTAIEAPGSGDPHTAFAIREISRLASDEDGCHGQANRAYRQAIQNVIENLRASLAAYRQAEQANTMRT